MVRAANQANKQKSRRSCLMDRRREGKNYERGKKVEFAEQSLSDVRSALRLAQKMGKRLGFGEIL